MSSSLDLCHGRQSYDCLTSAARERTRKDNSVVVKPAPCSTADPAKRLSRPAVLVWSPTSCPPPVTALGRDRVCPWVEVGCPRLRRGQQFERKLSDVASNSQSRPSAAARFSRVDDCLGQAAATCSDRVMGAGVTCAPTQARSPSLSLQPSAATPRRSATSTASLSRGNGAAHP